jgi:hypothetical protein
MASASPDLLLLVTMLARRKLMHWRNMLLAVCSVERDMSRCSFLFCRSCWRFCPVALQHMSTSFCLSVSVYWHCDFVTTA